MSKKVFRMLFALCMSIMLLAGCGMQGQGETDIKQEQQEQTGADTSQEQDEAGVKQEEQDDDQDEAGVEQEEQDDGQDETDVKQGQDEADAKQTVRVGGLKGPTTMGLVKLLEDAQSGALPFSVDFTMAAAADELTPKLVQGQMDLAAVPCNLASVLYQKTEGQIQVLCVNTLGVLSIVDTGSSIHEIADLKGKTIYATGQGTTPEYSLRYLLEQNGLDPEQDVMIEWKSEAAEIVSIMTQTEEEVIAMLPQPFVTSAMAQVENLSVVVDMNEAWNALGNGSSLVTGVLVARKEFVDENETLIDSFLHAYQASCQYANEETKQAAQMIEAYDIVKAAIAEKALPKCNITFMEGDAMKTAVSGYLQILFDANPESIGGAMPQDGFYYMR